MHKRKSLAVLLAIPVVVFLWIIGWGLYWVGSKTTKVEPRNSPGRREFSIAVLTPEAGLRKVAYLLDRS
jgi:flagellar basal body-associated protein FliL